MKWHVGSSIMFLVIVLVLSACGASKTAEAPMLPQSPLPDVDEERTEPTPSPTLNVEEDSMETHASTNSIFPVTIEEWRNETQNRSTEFTREGDHYWRYGPGGTYTIGGWTDDDWDNNDAQADVALEEYWVARYPVTVQQYRAFIEDGGYDTEDYWTPEGWEWKVELGHTQPYLWGDEHLSDDNQPVVGVTWYEATAFANWLTAKLELPAGTIRLPTEAEWEAACAYDANGQRHPYPWGEQEPTRNLADFDDGSDPDRPASVGERPEGAAASGAQDLVGSVWEWTTSSYDGYASESGDVVGDFEATTGALVSIRGGSWWDISTDVRCDSRDRFLVSDREFHLGFRLFLPSHSEH
jgi:formylglycine-generating enzyme required for sulfatase activity